ncbi:MAG: hypothetical protein COB02_18145 [Candidatus Cloacimonadota bacterium]|nr:MAG: hypothetical protein COB02_18145 [Candidatus Cloacimonadota bacterium]
MCKKLIYVFNFCLLNGLVVANAISQESLPNDDFLLKKKVLLIVAIVLLLVNLGSKKKAPSVGKNLTWLELLMKIKELRILLHNGQTSALQMTSKLKQKIEHCLLQLDRYQNLSNQSDCEFYTQVGLNFYAKDKVAKNLIKTLENLHSFEVIDSKSRKTLGDDLNVYANFVFYHLIHASKDCSQNFKVQDSCIMLKIPQNKQELIDTNTLLEKISNLFDAWYLITSDNVKKLNQQVRYDSNCVSESLFSMSITSQGQVDANIEKLISKGDFTALETLKGRSTGYPELLSKQKSLNALIDKLGILFKLEISLKTVQSEAVASFCMKDLSSKSQSHAYSILIIDDEADKKYFKIPTIKKCLETHIVSVCEDYQNAYNDQKQYDLVFIDRNFYINNVNKEPVTLQHIKNLVSKFGKNQSILVSTDQEDCEDIFNNNAMISIAELPKYIHERSQRSLR